MSIGNNERELGSALKHLPVEGLVRSFPTTDEILRLGKQRRARHRATLVGSCAAAVFLTIFGVNSLTGPAAPSDVTVNSATATVSTWAARGDLTNDPRLGGTTSVWARQSARGVHVLFAGHVPGLAAPLALLAGTVNGTDLVRLVEWRANDQDAVLIRGTALPAGRDYLALGVSDVGNQNVFTYGPDGQPNTPVSHVGALHVLVLTSADVDRADFVSEQDPAPLTKSGAGVFTGSFTTTKPPAVALDGGAALSLDFLAQA